MNEKNYKNEFYNKYITHGQVKSNEPNNPNNNKLVHKLKNYLENDSKILDIGCGRGTLLLLFHQNGFTNLTGVELSNEMYASSFTDIKKYIKNVDLITFISNNLEEKYDCIILKDILEHFTREESITILDKLNLMLNPGGIFYIHVPNAEGVLMTTVLYADITHEQAFSQSSITSTLKLIGNFKVDVVEEIPGFHDIKSIIRTLLFYILTFHMRLLHFVESKRFFVPLSQNIAVFAIKIKENQNV